MIRKLIKLNKIWTIKLNFFKLNSLIIKFRAINQSNNKFTTPTTINKQVKSLYDFEAAEDNEISFAAGELITVLDDRYFSK